MTDLAFISAFVGVMRARWELAGGDERGEVTEKVIIVAIFAALAIAAGAIIVEKVTSKAQSIPTGP
jgi:hypothetical protein